MAPPLIDLGTTHADGTLRRWLAQQAIAKGEAILGAQLTSVGRLATNATSIPGWSVTIALALGGAICSALEPGSAQGSPAAPLAIFSSRLVWPAVAALVAILATAICCLIVLWPAYWGAPGYAPDRIMNAVYQTELEVLEAMASGYQQAINLNAGALNRLERWLRAAWLLFAAAPVIGGLVYLCEMAG